MMEIEAIELETMKWQNPADFKRQSFLEPSKNAIKIQSRHPKRQHRPLLEDPPFQKSYGIVLQLCNKPQERH